MTIIIKIEIIWEGVDSGPLEVLHRWWEGLDVQDVRDAQIMAKSPNVLPYRTVNNGRTRWR